MRFAIIGLLTALAVGCIEVGHDAEVGCFVDPSEPGCRTSGGSAGSGSGGGGSGGGGSGGSDAAAGGAEDGDPGPAGAGGQDG
jgi:hypothetical protein